MHIGQEWKTGILFAERCIDHITTTIRIRGMSSPTIGLGDGAEAMSWGTSYGAISHSTSY
ncbi:hypothetical protein E6H23_11260 [Candidatus Bathyarchaeota archaeon]|nr:MAG: hypothetical protein E6H23_11260 [Candidatus Bathyarchaeota archaeon]